MDFPDHLRRLFAYDDWANREAHRVLKAAQPPPARSQKLLAHILAAEELWLGRLLADKDPVEVWPGLSLEQCEARLGELSRRWSTYFEGMTAARLSAPIAYVKSKGEPWKSAVDRKSTRLNSSHIQKSRMPSSA